LPLARTVGKRTTASGHYHRFLIQKKRECKRGTPFFQNPKKWKPYCFDIFFPIFSEPFFKTHQKWPFELRSKWAIQPLSYNMLKI
jgi:hypothetical protein